MHEVGKETCEVGEDILSGVGDVRLVGMHIGDAVGLMGIDVGSRWGWGASTRCRAWMDMR